MSFFALALLIASCDKSEPADSGEPVVVDSDSVDTAPPEETSAPPVETGGETGGTDTAPPVTSSADLNQGGVITCDDPGDRSALGPLVLAYGGLDWATQYVAPRIGDLTFGRGTVIADLDRDGWLDIYAPNMGVDELFMGQADGTWDNETVERWHVNEEMTIGGSAVDVDDDGDLDLLTVNRGTPNQLYLNDGSGHFTLAEDAGLLDLHTGSVTGTWGDMDGDGDLDLFVGAHFSVGDSGFTEAGLPAASEPSELYENLGGGRFLDRSELLPENVQNSFIYAASWIDLDEDEDLDLYIVNDFGSYYEPNIALMNTLHDSGELGFYDGTADTSLGIAISGMGLGIGDINGDLLPDMLMTSWDDIALLESLGGSWYDSSLVRGIGHGGDRHTAWGVDLLDMDNDGDLDAPVMFGYLSVPSIQGFESPRYQPDALFELQDDGAFEQRAESWGFDDTGISRGFIHADLNNDGFLDLVKINLDGPRQMYLSRCDDSAWLRVSLTQPAPNRDAVGARVLVEAGGRTLIRWMLVGGTNLNSAGPAEVHFGLGDVDTVDRLTVLWPDGEIATFEDFSARQVVQVSRR